MYRGGSVPADIAALMFGPVTKELSDILRATMNTLQGLYDNMLHDKTHDNAQVLLNFLDDNYVKNNVKNIPGFISENKSSINHESTLESIIALYLHHPGLHQSLVVYVNGMDDIATYISLRIKAKTQLFFQYEQFQDLTEAILTNDTHINYVWEKEETLTIVFYDEDVEQYDDFDAQIKKAFAYIGIHIRDVDSIPKYDRPHNGFMRMRMRNKYKYFVNKSWKKDEDITGIDRIRNHLSKTFGLHVMDSVFHYESGQYFSILGNEKDATKPFTFTTPNHTFSWTPAFDNNMLDMSKCTLTITKQ